MSDPMELWETLQADASLDSWLEDEGAPRGAPGERFVVDTVEKVDWVLGKIADAEAQAEAVKARREATAARMAAMEKEYRDRAEGFRRYFGPEMELVARAELERRGGKSKTLKLDNGTVSFRVAAGSAKVKDERAALAFLRAWAPELVSTKEYVKASAAREAVESALKQDLIGSVPAWLELTEPGERVKFDTGIGKRKD